MEPAREVIDDHRAIEVLDNRFGAINAPDILTPLRSVELLCLFPRFKEVDNIGVLSVLL